MVTPTRNADVIVIGAGVIGLSLALELLRGGLRVAVFERGTVGPGGASWAGGGILSPLEPGVSPALMPLLRDSLAGYDAWCDGLQADSGINPEYRVSGLRVLPPADLAGWATLAEDCGWQTHADPDMPGTIMVPGVAQVRSPRLLRALAGAVRARGGTLREREPVQALIGGAKIAGVRTASGEHTAGVVVLAAGAWSAQLWPGAPLRPMRGEMLVFDAPVGALRSIVMRQGAYLIPRQDGRVLAGSTLEDIGFEHATSEAGRHTILAAARGMWPELGERPVLAHWSGLRPATPDGLPSMGWVRGHTGLYLSSGHFRLGITLAPGSARHAAREILAG